MANSFAGGYLEIPLTGAALFAGGEIGLEVVNQVLAEMDAPETFAEAAAEGIAATAAAVAPVVGRRGTCRWFWLAVAFLLVNTYGVWKWTHPEGGLFLWLTLPEGMSSVDLLAESIKQKVAFVPGNSFHPCGGGENTMRLNFSNATPEKINEGISRLGRVIRETMK